MATDDKDTKVGLDHQIPEITKPKVPSPIEVLHSTCADNLKAKGITVPPREQGKVSPSGIFIVEHGLALGIRDENKPVDPNTHFSVLITSSINDRGESTLRPVIHQLNQRPTVSGNEYTGSESPAPYFLEEESLQKGKQEPTSQEGQILQSLLSILPEGMQGEIDYGLVRQNITEAYSVYVVQDGDYYQAGSSTEVGFANLPLEKRIGTLTIIKYQKAPGEFGFLCFGRNFADNPEAKVSKKLVLVALPEMAAEPASANEPSAFTLSYRFEKAHPGLPLAEDIRIIWGFPEGLQASLESDEFKKLKQEDQEAYRKFVDMRIEELKKEAEAEAGENFFAEQQRKAEERGVRVKESLTDPVINDLKEIYRAVNGTQAAMIDGILDHMIDRNVDGLKVDLIFLNHGKSTLDEATRKRIIEVINRKLAELPTPKTPEVQPMPETELIKQITNLGELEKAVEEFRTSLSILNLSEAELSDRLKNQLQAVQARIAELRANPSLQKPESFSFSLATPIFEVTAANAYLLNQEKIKKEEIDSEDLEGVIEKFIRNLKSVNEGREMDLDIADYIPGITSVNNIEKKALLERSIFSNRIILMKPQNNLELLKLYKVKMDAESAATIEEIPPISPSTPPEATTKPKLERQTKPKTPEEDALEIIENMGWRGSSNIEELKKVLARFHRLLEQVCLEEEELPPRLQKKLNAIKTRLHQLEENPALANNEFLYTPMSSFLESFSPENDLRELPEMKDQLAWSQKSLARSMALEPQRGRTSFKDHLAGINRYENDIDFLETCQSKKDIREERRLAIVEQARARIAAREQARIASEEEERQIRENEAAQRDAQRAVEPASESKLRPKTPEEQALETLRNIGWGEATDLYKLQIVLKEVGVYLEHLNLIETNVDYLPERLSAIRIRVNDLEVNPVLQAAQNIVFKPVSLLLYEKKNEVDFVVKTTEEINRYTQLMNGGGRGVNLFKILADRANNTLKFFNYCLEKQKEIEAKQLVAQNQTQTAPAPLPEAVPRVEPPAPEPQLELVEAPAPAAAPEPGPVEPAEPEVVEAVLTAEAQALESERRGALETLQAMGWGEPTDITTLEPTLTDLINDLDKLNLKIEDFPELQKQVGAIRTRINELQAKPELNKFQREGFMLSNILPADNIDPVAGIKREQDRANDANGFLLAFSELLVRLNSNEDITADLVSHEIAATGYSQQRAVVEKTINTQRQVITYTQNTIEILELYRSKQEEKLN